MWIFKNLQETFKRWGNKSFKDKKVEKYIMQILIEEKQM